MCRIPFILPMILIVLPLPSMFPKQTEIEQTAPSIPQTVETATAEPTTNATVHDMIEEFTLGFSFPTWRQDKTIWIMTLACFGFAVVALLLAICLPRWFDWSTDDLSWKLMPYGLIILTSLCLYLGITGIRQYRTIRQDYIRTTGVVTKVKNDRQSDVSSIHLVFIDEQGVEHSFTMAWIYGILNSPVVHEELPVIYYRPDPNLAVVDDFWATYFPPWLALLIATCFLIGAAMELNCRIRIRTGKGAFELIGWIPAAIAEVLRIAEASKGFLTEQSSVEMYDESAEHPFDQTDNVPTTQSLIIDLRNLDPFVRQNAAITLGQTYSKRAIKPLGRALKDRDQDVRAAAKESLTQILIKTLNDKNPRTRSIAVRALGKIGGRRCVKSLIKIVNDKDLRVSEAAKEGLIFNTIKAFSNKDPDVRVNAARALGKIDSTRSVSSLCGVLQDKDPRVRANAAESLGKIGSKRACKSLTRSLKDKDPTVRSAAKEALEWIKKQNAPSG